MISSKNILNTAIFVFFVSANSSYGFENAKVLPKGIRNVTFKTVNALINEKTDKNGQPRPIAEPLQKNVTFADILKSESKLKQTQIKALMAKEGFEVSDSLGQMNAQMQGNITVTAPVVSYGLTKKLTLAVAIPYYKAHMAIATGFETSSTAQGFVDALSKPVNNQVAAAINAGGKLNDAVSQLNSKLGDNGYASLEDWNEAGVGDITIATKYLSLDHRVLKIAATNGVVLPTGRVDDPDNLIDVGFGDGTYDIFSSLIFDQEVGYGVVFNQYAKYTYQAPASTEKRLVIGEEKIEVEKKKLKFKLGDKVETGLSVQYAPDFGLVAGAGYVYSRKAGDKYKAPTAEIAESLNADTDQLASHAETKLGYSSLPAYKRGSIPVPFSTTLEYKKHLSSKNTPANDLVTLDVAVYF